MEEKALIIESIKLIVFDVDGTLAETDDYFVEKGSILIGKILPFIKKEHIQKIVRPIVMSGETVLHSFYRLLDLVGLDSLLSKAHSKFSVKNEYKYAEIKGMTETLKLLSKKFRIGIISSGGRSSTLEFVIKFELQSKIEYIISAEDCKFIKPHPMPLLKISELSGIPIKNCLMVGDTIFDILCAKRAGAYSAAVLSGFDSKFLIKRFHADWILESVNELPALLNVSDVGAEGNSSNNKKDLV